MSDIAILAAVDAGRQELITVRHLHMVAGQTAGSNAKVRGAAPGPFSLHIIGTPEVYSAASFPAKS